jgi:hypothetical protein
MPRMRQLGKGKAQGLGFSVCLSLRASGPPGLYFSRLHFPIVALAAEDLVDGPEDEVDGFFL